MPVVVDDLEMNAEETVGIEENPTSVVGKAVNGWFWLWLIWWLAGASTDCQFTAGLCLRTYWFWPGTVVNESPMNPTDVQEFHVSPSSR